MPTFNDLVEDALSVDSFDGNLYRSLIKREINVAAQRVTRRLTIPLLATDTPVDVAVNAATALVDPSAPYLTSVSSAAVYAGGRMQQWVVPQGQHQAVNQLEQATHPSWFRAFRRRVAVTPYSMEVIRLRLFPIPLTAFTLRLTGQKAITPLVGDSDEFALPDDFVEPVITYARAKAYRREDDIKAHDALMAQFNQDLVDLAAVDVDGAQIAPTMWDEAPYPDLA